MKIKELEEKSGVPRTAIHFYLRNGLLHPPEKTGKTMAYYDNSHLTRLKKIQAIKKDRRVPLRFLKEQLALDKDGAGTGETEKNRSLFGQSRPTTNRERKQKYQLIVQKAIEVFSRNGYHNTRITDITSALKISTGTFYIYFGNKRDLFIEVIDEVFRAIVGDAAAALKGERDFIEKMRIRGRIFYENYKKYNELLNQLRAEMTRESSWPAEKLKGIYHGLTLPVIQDIQTAVDQGIIRPVDPDLTAYALTGQIEIMALRLSLDDTYTIEDIDRYMVETYFTPLLLKNNPGSQPS